MAKAKPAPIKKRAATVDPHRLTVQMPGELRDALGKSAAENGRSLGAEVVFRLNKTFGIKPGRTA